MGDWVPSFQSKEEVQKFIQAARFLMSNIEEINMLLFERQQKLNKKREDDSGSEPF